MTDTKKRKGKNWVWRFFRHRLRDRLIRDVSAAWKQTAPELKAIIAEAEELGGVALSSLVSEFAAQLLADAYERLKDLRARIKAARE